LQYVVDIVFIGRDLHYIEYIIPKLAPSFPKVRMNYWCWNFLYSTIELNTDFFILDYCFHFVISYKYPGRNLQKWQKVMLGTLDLFLLKLRSPSCLNITFCPAFHHLLPSQTTSLISNHNMPLICAYCYSNRRVVLCTQGYRSVCSFLGCVKNI